MDTRQFNFKTLFCLIFISTFLVAKPRRSFGQISPPGLDETKLASWMAIGVNQKFAPKWSTTLYAGGGMQSDPDNFALVKKPSIVVFNQETLFEMNHHWQVAFCASYRLQNRYQKDAPFESADPELRDEMRLYLRLFYRTKIGRTSFSYSFRPEYRNFYTNHQVWYPQPVELRFRLKGQANFSLSEAHSLQLVIADEFLTAADHIHNPLGELQWTELHLTENRLSTYVRKAIKKPNAFVDVGVMHQLRFANGEVKYIAHLAVDLIFQHPFGKRGN